MISFSLAWDRHGRNFTNLLPLRGHHLQRVYANLPIMTLIEQRGIVTTVRSNLERDRQMNFRSRYVGSSIGHTTQTQKNWVIGWTPDEAKAAAQQERSVKPSTIKVGMFGALVSTGKR